MSRHRIEVNPERTAIGAVRFLAITGTIAGALALTGAPTLAAVDAGQSGRSATVSYDNGKNKKDSKDSGQVSDAQASAGNGGNTGSDAGHGNTTSGNGGNSSSGNGGGSSSGNASGSNGSGGSTANPTAADIAKNCVDHAAPGNSNDPVQNLINGNPVVGDLLANNGAINPAAAPTEGQTNSTTSNPADVSVSDAIRTSIDQALQCDPAGTSGTSGSGSSGGSGGSSGSGSSGGSGGSGNVSSAQNAVQTMRNRALSGQQSSGGVAQNAINNMTANNGAAPATNAADPPAPSNMSNNVANPSVVAPPSGSNTRSASVDPVNGAVAGPASTGAGFSDPTITAQGGGTTASTTALGGGVMSGTVPKAHLIVQDNNGVMTVAAIGAAASAVVTVPHGEAAPPKPVAPPAKPSAPPMKTVEVPPASLPPAEVAHLPSTGVGQSLVAGANGVTDLAAVAAAAGVAALGALGLRRRALR